MKIIIDLPDLPESSEQLALEWVQELIDNSPIKKHIKGMAASNTQTASHIYKCAVCGHSDFFLK